MFMYACTFELYCLLSVGRPSGQDRGILFMYCLPGSCIQSNLNSLRSQHLQGSYISLVVPGLIVGFVLIVYYRICRNASRVLSRLMSAAALIADIN